MQFKRGISLLVVPAIVLSLVAAAAAMALAGCGDNVDTTTTTTATTTAAATTDADAATTTPTTTTTAAEAAATEAPQTEDGERYGDRRHDDFLIGNVIGVAMPWRSSMDWGPELETNDTFMYQLESAGYTAIIQNASERVMDQQLQIESMIEYGARAIVVTPVDGARVGAALEKAKAAGVFVIAYDSLVENTAAVDCIVRFDSFKAGELQGLALLQGLAELKGAGPYNVELFGGDPDDPDAQALFAGAMEALQPKIEDGTIVVASGQTGFAQCATPDWDNGAAQARMESLLTEFYSDEELHGALAPNDGIARTVIVAPEYAERPIPVVCGLGAEDTSISWVWLDRQYCTIYKPVEAIVSRVTEIIELLLAGESLPPPDATVNNGAIDIGVYEVEPTAITKANAREVFANDIFRVELLVE